MNTNTQNSHPLWPPNHGESKCPGAQVPRPFLVEGRISTKYLQDCEWAEGKKKALYSPLNPQATALPGMSQIYENTIHARFVDVY